jgi:transcription-repair coupling factor (superfamily II helicase)
VLGTERAERFPLDELVRAASAGTRAVEIEGVSIDSLAYVAVRLGQRLERPVVLITPEAAEARRVANTLRFFGGDAAAVTLLPEIEASPYGHLSPDRGAVMETVARLTAFAWGRHQRYTVLSAATLARRIVPPSVLVDHSYLIAVAQSLDREACLKALADGGYQAVSSVEDPGTFAVRGGVLDVFPPNLTHPVRVELWGDEVETIKIFDPVTQRTRGDAVETVVIPPVREELLVGEFKGRARLAVRRAAADAGIPTRTLQPLLDDLANGIPFLGIEGLRPAFFESLSPLFEVLPEDALFFLFDPMGIGERWRSDWASAAEGYDAALADQQVALPPAAHALSPNALQHALERVTCVRAHTMQIVDELGATEGPERAIAFEIPNNGDLSHALVQARGDSEPLRPLAEWVRSQVQMGVRVVVASPQGAQLDRLERVFKGYGVPVRRADKAPDQYLQSPRQGEAGVVLVSGEAGGGFRLLSHGFALVTEEEIFGRKAPRRRKSRRETASPFVQSFASLEVGDYVVHTDHGIARYSGLKKLVINGAEADFLLMEFAGNDKLYLPVYKLGRLQKYTAGKASARTDKLGSTAWQKVRARAKESAEEDAYALLELYARRELAEGFAFDPPDAFFRAFEATFPFRETDDQARAIEEVIDDMCRPHPMDRLLCGDVGFGKTEVAIRAALKAVIDGKQVCVLVPTTVLSLQHFQVFSARFADYPVNIALFSRLVSRSALKAQLEALAIGEIDIAIGTHRLLSKDVEYLDLGLLILDEEHRFGVRHKERLKTLRTNVDVLAMTATPIPRTLQMSISGIRDLSVITTPPLDRLSVRTFVCRTTDQVARDAVMRELGRGGQVFFVHNRVETIEARKAWLAALVPEARIVVGHGQMEPAKIEKVMVDFTEGRFNVLLSTTIIESGIDIPTANTMLIDNADRFGLAQLYQLRGRVGRSRERGYCYLLVASETALRRDARARLAVIQKFTELGSGFHVASHDMELRGAGELLGTRQKGHVQAVGIDLYAQLIEDAVRTLRGQAARVEFDPDINIQLNARIPEDYVPDTHLRLVLYKRLANAEDDAQVLTVADELVDRFGPRPGPVDNLVAVMRIRTLARRIGLKSLDHGPRKLQLVFDPQSPLSMEAVVALVTDPRSGFTAPANYRLLYDFDVEERRDTVVATRLCLQRLAELVTDHDDDSR